MKWGEDLQTSQPVKVTVTNASTTVAALNPARGQLIIWVPPGTTPVFLSLGATAATAVGGHTLQLQPSSTNGAYYEVPMAGRQVYIGPVTAIVTAGTVDICVTEISR